MTKLRENWVLTTVWNSDTKRIFGSKKLCNIRWLDRRQQTLLFNQAKNSSNALFTSWGTSNIIQCPVGTSLFTKLGTNGFMRDA